MFTHAKRWIRTACYVTLGSLLISSIGLPAPSAHAAVPRQMEKLDRGLVAVKVTTGVLVSWRLLGTEASGTSFNVYRGGVKLNASPITNSTNYQDNSGTTSSSYTVRAVVGGIEQVSSAAVTPWATNYLDVPLQRPAGGTTPDGVNYTYNANAKNNSQGEEVWASNSVGSGYELSRDRRTVFLGRNTHKFRYSLDSPNSWIYASISHFRRGRLLVLCRAVTLPLNDF